MIFWHQKTGVLTQLSPNHLNFYHYQKFFFPDRFAIKQVGLTKLTHSFHHGVN